MMRKILSNEKKSFSNCSKLLNTTVYCRSLNFFVLFTSRQVYNKTYFWLDYTFKKEILCHLWIQLLFKTAKAIKIYTDVTNNQSQNKLSYFYIWRYQILKQIKQNWFILVFSKYHILVINCLYFFRFECESESLIW